jgi:hypothetical protein
MSLTLTTRQGKGEKLTIQDMDDNLIYLRQLSQTGPYDFEIGEFVSDQGGIVFHREKEGALVNYLVVATGVPAFVGQPWSNVTNVAVGGSQSSWDGLTNSSDIVNQQGHSQSAARTCLDYSAGGYTDWYLPAIDELFLLFSARFSVNRRLSQVGGSTLLYQPNSMISPIYWSSTESPAVFAPPPTPSSPSVLALDFNRGGITGVTNKGNGHFVRAIRRFSLSLSES